jgi:hypothetical protein
MVTNIWKNILLLYPVYFFSQVEKMAVGNGRITSCGHVEYYSLSQLDSLLP